LGVFFGGRQAQIFPKTPTHIPKLKEVVKNMEAGQAFTRFWQILKRCWANGGDLE
jgi:hypothetical protein